MDNRINIQMKEAKNVKNRRIEKKNVFFLKFSIQILNFCWK